MALQGSLDAFDLADVLRLLGSTAKTGTLEVLTPRGPGAIVLEDGRIVAVRAPGTRADTGPVLTAVHLLRHRSGEFRFDPAGTVTASIAPLNVDHLLGEAAGLLATWREVEAVVPSLGAEVWLAPELPGEEVVVPAQLWRLVVAAAGGASVGGVAEALGLTEFDACRLVRDAANLGLLLVDPEPPSASVVAPAAGTWAAPHGGLPPVPSPETAPATVIPLFPPPEEPEDVPAFPEDGLDEVPEDDAGFDVAGLDVADVHAEPAETATDELVDDRGVEDLWGFGPVAAVPAGVPGDGHRPVAAGGSLGIDIPGLPSLSPTWDAPATGGEDDDDDGEEILLGQLTPQAARAIAAAARATSEAERDAAIEAAIAANDEPLDRRALLRFLSSVRQ